MNLDTKLEKLLDEGDLIFPQNCTKTVVNKRDTFYVLVFGHLPHRFCGPCMQLFH